MSQRTLMARHFCAAGPTAAARHGSCMLVSCTADLSALCTSRTAAKVSYQKLHTKGDSKSDVCAEAGVVRTSVHYWQDTFVPLSLQPRRGMARACSSHAQPISQRFVLRAQLRKYLAKHCTPKVTASLMYVQRLVSCEPPYINGKTLLCRLAYSRAAAWLAHARLMHSRSLSALYFAHSCERIVPKIAHQM